MGLEISYTLQFEILIAHQVFGPILSGTSWRMPFIEKEVLEFDDFCLLISVKLENLV